MSIVTLKLFESLIMKPHSHIAHSLVLRNLLGRDYYEDTTNTLPTATNDQNGANDHKTLSDIKTDIGYVEDSNDTAENKTVDKDDNKLKKGETSQPQADSPQLTDQSQPQNVCPAESSSDKTSSTVGDGSQSQDLSHHNSGSQPPLANGVEAENDDDKDDSGIAEERTSGMSTPEPHAPMSGGCLL